MPVHPTVIACWRRVLIDGDHWSLLNVSSALQKALSDVVDAAHLFDVLMYNTQDFDQDNKYTIALRIFAASVVSSNTDAMPLHTILSMWIEESAKVTSEYKDGINRGVVILLAKAIHPLSTRSLLEVFNRKPDILVYQAMADVFMSNPFFLNDATSMPLDTLVDPLVKENTPRVREVIQNDFFEGYRIRWVLDEDKATIVSGYSFVLPIFVRLKRVQVLARIEHKATVADACDDAVCRLVECALNGIDDTVGLTREALRGLHVQISRTKVEREVLMSIATFVQTRDIGRLVTPSSVVDLKHKLCHQEGHDDQVCIFVLTLWQLELDSMSDAERLRVKDQQECLLIETGGPRDILLELVHLSKLRHLVTLACYEKDACAALLLFMQKRREHKLSTLVAGIVDAVQAKSEPSLVDIHSLLGRPTLAKLLKFRPRPDPVAELALLARLMSETAATEYPPGGAAYGWRRVCELADHGAKVSATTAERLALFAGTRARALDPPLRLVKSNDRAVDLWRTRVAEPRERLRAVLTRLRCLLDSDDGSSRGIAPVVVCFLHDFGDDDAASLINERWLDVVSVVVTTPGAPRASRAEALRLIDERLQPRSDPKATKLAKKARRREKKALTAAACPSPPTRSSFAPDDENEEDEADDDDVGVNVERLAINLTPTWCELGRAAGHARPRTMHQRSAVEAPPLPDPPAAAKQLPTRSPSPEPPPPDEPALSPELPSTQTPPVPPPPPSTQQHDLECGLCYELEEHVGRALTSCLCCKACHKCITAALAASKTSSCPFCRREGVSVLVSRVVL